MNDYMFHFDKNKSSLVTPYNHEYYVQVGPKGLKGENPTETYIEKKIQPELFLFFLSF